MRDGGTTSAYGVDVEGLALPASVELVEGGWAAYLAGAVDAGMLSFVGRPLAAPPLVTVRFATFESAGSAFEFVRLMAAHGGRASLRGDPREPARHEVEFVMEDRTDPVSAMRVATTVLYEAEGTRGFSVLRTALSRVGADPVRADPSDGSDYARGFAAIAAEAGLAQPAAALGRPRRRAAGTGVEIVSSATGGCGIRHRLDDAPGLAEGRGSRGYVVIPTRVVGGADGRLRAAMVGMMRPRPRAG